jgi:prepilin-type N-terminal cleavage/methylation domain-containing protein
MKPLHIITRTALAGFTLIELMVVVSIIGVMASVVAAAAVSTRQKGIDSAVIATLAQLRSAMELYKSDHGYYPGQNITPITSGMPPSADECEPGMANCAGNNPGLAYLIVALVPKYIASISMPANMAASGYQSGFALPQNNPLCGGSAPQNYLFEFAYDHAMNATAMSGGYLGSIVGQTYSSYPRYCISN